MNSTTPQTCPPNLELGSRRIGQKPKLLDEVRINLRANHYSRKTEESYLAWMKRFILFHNKRHPNEMGGDEIKQFLNHLAVERQVSSLAREI